MPTRRRPFACRRLAALAAVVLAVWGANPARAYDNQIFMDPSVKVVSTAAESLFTVDVARNQGDYIAGFDVEISFDNTIVELLAVTPGLWITRPGFPYFFFDYTTPGTDRIRFAEAFLGQLCCYQSGALAVCHFRALQEGISPLTFVMVKARDVSNNPVVVTPSAGDRIVIESAVPVETSSFGRVKALYRR